MLIKTLGNPITKEELFKYTNGRFLSEEDRQLSKRYVRFDVDRLCDVIASIPETGTWQVSKIEKMEGGFSKALLVTTVDGSEYIVKIPCPNAGRPMYCTASEVAVLSFVGTHTTIPVPKVLAWSADPTNPVGAEYIVMERVPGVQIFKKWDEMGESNRISIIKRLTQWERELTGIRFPAFGSLYHKSSLRGSLGEHDWISLDPSVDPEGLYCIGPSCDSAWTMQHSPSVHCGPCYQEGQVMPKLPPDYEDMDADDKEIALYNKEKATWTKAYEVASFLNDRTAWRAMQVPSPLKELFRRVDTWDEGILPLRETLIELFRSQRDLGFTESLPLSFNDEQIAAHKKEFEVYQEWHEMRSFVKQVLDTDDDGWVPPERDFTEIKSRNKALFDYYISKPSLNKTPDEARSLWPFLFSSRLRCPALPISYAPPPRKPFVVPELH
ncbi:aminoglycoside phosphotransferase [Aspergillus terreus]|uniref:Altered inheritance of mitochondria protein 9, mitochondrial n=1 Tax=Aspergillus terreus TaxID=33178 RepID=A0A5M3ZDN9_ASPTE|nr:hypothetical protein ATETN484_0017004300 [Aspergillus terreus]GFF21718.1 aminoglycoside phosphotransferase [Aspergillus terreus]